MSETVTIKSRPDTLLSSAMARHTVSATVWSTLGKAVGFLVPFFVAAWFGVSSETDVFFFVYGLIMFFTGIFATAVETVIVPFISQVQHEDKKALGSFIGNSLIVSALVVLFVSALFLIFMRSGASFLTRFSKDQISLLFHLSLETSPLLVLLSLTSILGGVLNAHKKFVIPAISPAVRAIMTIGVIFLLKDRMGVHAIAAGYVLGELFRLLFFISIILSRNIFPIDFSLNISPRIKDFLRTASYQVFCLSAVGLNPVIDKVMASWLAPGSVSILHYADRIYMIPVGFLSAGLFPVALSHWSNDFNRGMSKDAIFLKVTNLARMVFFGALAVSVVLILVRRPLIHLVYARGKFPLESIPTLEWTWVCYLVGLAPFIAGSMFTQAHLALKNTAFLMKAAFLNCALNIILNYILMRFFGIAGIALATSITVVLISILLLTTFSKMEISHGKS